jgi:hypothetical protein
MFPTWVGEPEAYRVWLAVCGDRSLPAFSQAWLMHSGFGQVKHQGVFHQHSSWQYEWHKVTAREAEIARADEEMWIATLPKCVIPSNWKVRHCLHCLDCPSEGSWRALEDIRDHMELFFSLQYHQDTTLTVRK